LNPLYTWVGIKKCKEVFYYMFLIYMIIRDDDIVHLRIEWILSQVFEDFFYKTS
jgi:hypothetical protein